MLRHLKVTLECLLWPHTLTKLPILNIQNSTPTTHSFSEYCNLYLSFPLNSNHILLDVTCVKKQAQVAATRNTTLHMTEHGANN